MSFFQMDRKVENVMTNLSTVPTVEDAFHIFLVMTDENFNPIVTSQFQVSEENNEPESSFSFDEAVDYLRKLSEVKIELDSGQ